MGRVARVVCGVIGVALVTLAPAAAAAQTPSASHWRARWPRFHGAEVVLTLVSTGVGLGIYFHGERRTPGWVEPLPLDREARAVTVGGTRDDRETISLVSDALFIGMMAYPVVVDALLAAGAIHGDSDSMAQMLLIDAEALSLGLLASMLTTRLVGRQRPYVQECGAHADYAAGCAEAYLGQNTSFVGGHALMTFLGAGLVCAHHVHNPWLYGSEAAGATACAAGLGVASAVTLMRMIGDRHWLSDLAAGAALGSAIGWLVPLLHYAVGRGGGRAGSAQGPAAIAALPTAPGTDVGITIAATL